jgi:hypothetical protein
MYIALSGSLPADKSGRFALYVLEVHRSERQPAGW